MTSLGNYVSDFQDEMAFVPLFIKLLENDRAFHRDHLPGHITGSAWITDEDNQFALLTHHAKLNRWLQPGGHADGDENITGIAMREAFEETGLTSLKAATPGIYDLDIHPIPARKDFQEHLHYDIRIHLIASLKEKFTVSEESHDLAWVKMEDLPVVTNYNFSIMRMALKGKK